LAVAAGWECPVVSVVGMSYLLIVVSLEIYFCGFKDIQIRKSLQLM
jgi:hypothetical protein